MELEMRRNWRGVWEPAYRKPGTGRLLWLFLQLTGGICTTELFRILLSSY